MTVSFNEFSGFVISNCERKLFDVLYMDIPQKRMQRLHGTNILKHARIETNNDNRVRKGCAEQG